MRLENRSGLQLNGLGLDQDGNDLARGEAEGAVVQTSQKLGDCTRMRRDADPRVLIGAEHVVEGCLGTGGKRLGCFAVINVPELVVLGEAGFEVVGGEQLGDVCLRAEVIQRSAGSKSELPK